MSSASSSVSLSDAVLVGDLKAALRSTLDQRGTLDDIRAKLRAEIFNAMDDHDLPKPKLCNENLFINELIREYFEYNKYNHTLSVFLAETGQPIEKPFPRSYMTHSLHLAESERSSQLPLLYSIVALLQKDIKEAQKVEEKTPSYSIRLSEHSSSLASLSSLLASSSPSSSSSFCASLSSSLSSPLSSTMSLSSFASSSFLVSSISSTSSSSPSSFLSSVTASASLSSASISFLSSSNSISFPLSSSAQTKVASAPSFCSSSVSVSVTQSASLPSSSLFNMSTSCSPNSCLSHAIDDMPAPIVISSTP
eukprot:TRINITY_DN4266_c3_g1_i1.p1 TRINITY_DN4266_c3_g1~~TRINITY_DN4266_c3_g1_i1.p1  ORF type:complete len:308 (+),score=92.18 TRINITY_DN4266_c3_g1_i1:97-1020(+)